MNAYESTLNTAIIDSRNHNTVSLVDFHGTKDLALNSLQNILPPASYDYDSFRETHNNQEIVTVWGYDNAININWRLIIKIIS